ncbi:hypothetical protein PFLUV_G00077370 [Perca fluviatilis]|uniref:Uncharacterized protein n=1 Tax=Perca fluviatilis TaxID=8168 RepID=A0A6A5EKI0_PERFL|nr:hypothetical protein PFLUV_G00077370 [Perca fluviatilis]
MKDFRPPQKETLMDLKLSVYITSERVRRAPDESKKKKKDKKKNKEPKDPNATKKPKTDKKKKKKDRQTTTTLPPTTTEIPTEPPTEPEPYTEYQYPDIDDDYWKPDEDYWEAGPTPPQPQPRDPITDAPDNYDDYWRPDEREPTSPAPDAYDDYWTPDNKDPYAPVTEPTPLAPKGDGKTDDTDYWDATYEVPESLPFPDGEEVSPEIKVETLPGNSYSHTLQLVVLT